MNTCVIIPTYNESKQVGNIVRRLLQQNLKVVVVDDGSRDATPLIALENGATVIRNKVNTGVGASLIKGFDYAIKNNFDAVITMDGDGQHLPEEAKNFIDTAQKQPVSLFIGNRMLNTRGMPGLRWLTNKLMSWLISKIIKQHIPDTQCGFRLIKTEVLKKIKFTTFKYEILSEMIIKIARAGYQIKSVPIRTVYRSEKSKINPVTDTLRFIKYIFRELRHQY